MSQPHDEESLLDIILLIQPDFPISQLKRRAGGQRWWIPSDRPDEMAEKRAAIQADPCRDYRVIARRYGVSIRTVYNAWKARKA